MQPLGALRRGDAMRVWGGWVRLVALIQLGLAFHRTGAVWELDLEGEEPNNGTTTGEVAAEAEKVTRQLHMNTYIAVCFFGHLPHTKESGKLPSVKLLSEYVLPLFLTHVVSPAVAAGLSVDIYGHAWRLTNRAGEARFTADFLEKKLRKNLPNTTVDRLQVVVSSDRADREDFDIGMFQSIQRAMYLMQHSGREYRLLLLLRWDVAFFSPFQAALLNPNLFYVASRCSHPDHSEWSERHLPLGKSGKSALCRPVTQLDHKAATCNDTERVPEWYFAGGPPAVRRVFTGIIEALDARVFGNGTTTCARGLGVVGRRLLQLREQGELLTGRYKVHRSDISLVRDDPAHRHDTWDKRWDCYKRLNGRDRVMLWNPAEPSSMYNLSIPLDVSLCPESARFCWCEDRVHKYKKEKVRKDFLVTHGADSTRDQTAQELQEMHVPWKLQATLEHDKVALAKERKQVTSKSSRTLGHKNHPQVHNLYQREHKKAVARRPTVRGSG